MPTVPIYTRDGSESGTLELASDVFGVAPSPAVLHQVVVAALANARNVVAHTKRRGEVRGGGKKPWAQKHTGRARHGSIRSPLWVGGGITFGPNAKRNFTKKVNAKVRRQALRMALSDKVAQQRLLVIDDFAPTAAKTQDAQRIMTAVLAHAPHGKRVPKVLLVLPEERRGLARTIRNLERTTGIDAANLNVLDVLRNDVCIVTKRAVEVASERFRPKRA